VKPHSLPVEVLSAALQDRIVPTSGRLIKAEPIRLPAGPLSQDKLPLGGHFFRNETVRVLRDSREAREGDTLVLERPAARYGTSTWTAWKEATGGKWRVLVDVADCERVSNG
jgi:hypothetical protein